MENRLRAELERTNMLRRPMEAEMADAAYTRWLQKPVEKTLQIPLAEQFNALRMEGIGHMGLNASHSRGKSPCLTLTYQAVQPLQHPSGRAYSTAEIFVPMAGADLHAYNRLSIWVYVDTEVSSTNHMSLYIRNKGPVVMPVPGRFEGYHTETVNAKQWTRVLWEIPDVSRNNVTDISFSFQASGTSYPGDPEITCYLDDLRLEAVSPDSDKGFALRDDAIAYCHSGYLSESRKQALVQHRCGTFTLRNMQGQEVYQGEAAPAEDGFALLDFTSFTQSGMHTLHIGDLSTKPFPIGSSAYLSCAFKTLNFFFVERCGFTVPTVHTECHLDVMSVHPDGRKRCIAGGWHDAGDLTQDGRNTMECTLAMLETYQQAAAAQPELAQRSLEEARWGLDWLMRTRWGDGYRHCGRIIGFWTDNTIGTTDDIHTKAENRPYDNLLVSSVFAQAAVIFQKEDPMYAALCARYAREDFAFGMEWMHQSPFQTFSFVTQLQMNAQAALSAITLYNAFGDASYLWQAARFARVVMRCQCMSPKEGFAIPLYGYFYETEAQTRVQAYFHRSYEHVAVEAIGALYLAAPTHEDAKQWRESLDAYAQYLLEMEKLTPYGLCASYVYELDNADFANLYHEGDRSLGAPSIEEYNEQVRSGIQLDATHFIRIFPVAYQFRGFHAPVMGKALAALAIDRALGNAHLRDLAARQLEWMLGYNPFASSTVYGEGNDFHPLYTGMQPQIVGAVPVGFETFQNEDIPYYPVQCLPTYKEIWVHTTGRLLKCIAALLMHPDKDHEREVF